MATGTATINPASIGIHIAEAGNTWPIRMKNKTMTVNEDNEMALVFDNLKSPVFLSTLYNAEFMIAGLLFAFTIFALKFLPHS